VISPSVVRLNLVCPCHGMMVLLLSRVSFNQVTSNAEVVNGVIFQF
jgi:hypothetical protein